MLLELFLSLTGLYCLRVLCRRWKYDLHRIPSPPGLPFLGHTLVYAMGMARTQTWLWNRTCFRQLGYPRIIYLNVAGRDWVVVRDTSFVKNVMNSKTDPFHRFLDVGTFVLPALGNDATAKSIMFDALPTPYVKAFRKIFTVALSSSNLAKMMPKLNNTLDRVLDIVEAKRQAGLVDFQDLCSKFTLDAIGELAFDINLGGLDGSRSLHYHLGRVGDICRANFANPFQKKYCEWFPWTKAGQKYHHDIEALKFEWDLLVQSIRSRSAPSEEEEPFWWLLRNLKDPETGKPIDDKSLRAELAVTVMAGMETTGQQLAWILCLLASHSRVHEVLLNELKDYGLYRLDGKEINYQDLGELKYLSAIIKEGMRMAYTLSDSMIRVVPEDMEILGYRIPKGTLINAVGTRASDSEEEWGDPDVFRPERWLKGEDMSDKYFLGFSNGPRDCVGQRLAMLEMRLGIVRVMQRYHLELEGDWRELLDNAFDAPFTKAKGGLRFHVTPRVLE